MSQLPNLGTVDFGSDFSLELDAFLKKPYDDIGEAAVELPAIIEWVNQQQQWIIETRQIQKQELRTIRATVYIRLKNGGAADLLPGKVSEQAVEHLLEMDEGVIAKNTELAKTSAWASRLGNLLYVLQAKLDLVRSTESTRRQLIENTHDE
jgi:hypothetical protein